MAHIVEEFDQIESTRGWNILFQKLARDHHNLCSEKRNDAATLLKNRPFNRYRDVLPYDETRVHLINGPNDYINANYIEVPLANRRYILTQGPLPETTKYFWQMIWEQNSRVIIMLTHLTEKGYTKCHLYYPEHPDETDFTFEDLDLMITFIDMREFRHYTLRKFELMNIRTGECRPIIHWSEFDWPDHGAPNQPEPFLQFLCDVRQSGAFDPSYGAPVIHCSAGIGRSGTFVLVDSILKMLVNQSETQNISLSQVLALIRSQRQGLIQTVDQLRFSYLAIISALDNLDEFERSDRPFNQCQFEVSSGSEDEEAIDTENIHPKICRRQNNIMADLRLTGSTEDFDSELIRRMDSVVSNYQSSPNLSRHTIINNGPSASDKFKSSPLSTPRGSDSSLRFRQKISTPTDSIEKSTDTCATEELLTDLSDNIPLLNNTHQQSIMSSFVRKYKYSMFLGALVLLTGSFCLYKSVTNTNRNR